MGALKDSEGKPMPLNQQIGMYNSPAGGVSGAIVMPVYQGEDVDIDEKSINQIKTVKVEKYSSLPSQPLHVPNAEAMKEVEDMMKARGKRHALKKVLIESIAKKYLVPKNVKSGKK
jgi:hypothetical protein